MGNLDQVSSIFWLLLGLAVVLGSYRLGLGTGTNPGPGFTPFWCGIILCGASALVFFQQKPTPRAEGRLLRKFWDGSNWSKPLYVIIALLAYVMTFERIGFLLGTTPLLIFLFKAIEPEKWSRAIISAVLTVVISYFLFSVWLQVQLPRGFFEQLFL
jgi:hypothetical protein